jgi:hypothetical protein
VFHLLFGEVIVCADWRMLLDVVACDVVCCRWHHACETLAHLRLTHPVAHRRSSPCPCLCSQEDEAKAERIAAKNKLESHICASLSLPTLHVAASLRSDVRLAAVLRFWALVENLLSCVSVAVRPVSYACNSSSRVLFASCRWRAQHDHRREVPGAACLLCSSFSLRCLMFECVRLS